MVPSLSAMEVLLLQDVKTVGKKNDLLLVGDGFALNFLLPKRQAIVATPAVRKIYAEAIKMRLEEREREKKAQAGKIAALAGIALTFSRKTTKTGKLYAAISEKVIADALKKEHNVVVPQSAIIVTEPIKETVTFTAAAKISGQEQQIKIIVEAANPSS